MQNARLDEAWLYQEKDRLFASIVGLRILSTDYTTRGIFHEKVVEMVVYIEQHSPAVVILNQPDVGTTGQGQKRIVQASGPPATRIMSTTPLSCRQ